MNLYCYAKPNQMVGHKFADDVAIVFAFSKKSAYNKLRKYYSEIQISDIFKIPFNRNVHILTDY